MITMASSKGQLSRNNTVLEGIREENLDFKEVEENYKYYVDRRLPEFLHQGDFQQGSRLLSYADAMMATCATFLVVPLRNLKGKKDGESLEEYLKHNKDQYVSFVAGFLLVCTIWESMNIRSIIVKQKDDFYVFFTIALLMLVSILPFSLALVGHFPKYEISVCITCTILVIIELLEAIMNFYAFRSTRLLHILIQKYAKSDLMFLRNTIFCKSFVNILIFVCAGAFSYVNYRVSWFFLTLIFFLPSIRQLIFFIHRKIYGVPEKHKCMFFNRFKNGYIHKERVEAFSDAAIAVIACLLILDITTEDFPRFDDVLKSGLGATLRHLRNEFVIYFITYIIVSMLWYVNHSIFEYIQTVSAVILYLQKIFLMFVAWIPLASNCLLKYGRREDEDTKTAVRMIGIIVLFSGLCNLAKFCWGVYVQSEVLHKSVICNDFKSTCKKHLYLVLKMTNIPFCMIVMLFATQFGHGSWCITITEICFAIAIVTFILLKIIFLNYHVEPTRTNSKRGTSYHVNSGIIETNFVDRSGSNVTQREMIRSASKKSRKDCGKDEVDCGKVNKGLECGDDQLSDSDVSDLRSEYGSFRGGAKFINGVKVDVPAGL